MREVESAKGQKGNLEILFKTETQGVESTKSGKSVGSDVRFSWVVIYEFLNCVDGLSGARALLVIRKKTQN